MMRLLRRGPPTTRSTASSSAAPLMTVPFSRAVSSAASLMTLARSAPDMPTVRLASPSRSASGAIGLPCEGTLHTARPPGQVGVGDGDLSVEPAGPQQGGVEDVRPVGRRDQDDALALAEAVHLDKQLVEGLLAFVVAAAHACATLAADGVDLVDEDDARAVLLGLVEHVADARSADADEH